jgi:uncharacterized DUF497 family protein
MIIWDEGKNNQLQKQRNISFEEATQIILNGDYLDILENPARKEQYIFIIMLNDYIHVVPFIVDNDNNMVLKTIYPSRKFHHIYGGE